MKTRSDPRRPAAVVAAALCGLVILVGCSTKPLSPAVSHEVSDAPDRPADVIRFATFNAALSGSTAEDLPTRLATPDDPDLQKVAAIIQRVRPDVLLINEFDHDPTGQLAADFQTNYLGVVQGDAEAITFAHAHSPPVNTGLPTGIDLNGDGQIGGPADAHGWGEFPGQYGMLLLSRLDQPFTVWADLQGVLWSREGLYGDTHGIFPFAAHNTLRLSSKTHLILRAEWKGRLIGVFISHPTPPVFDGPEDRNGKRNYDEIQLIKHLISDTQPVLPSVVMGDLNADPNDGESIPGAINQLLNHPKLTDPQPKSRGAVDKALADGGINADHKTDPALDTADWNDDPDRGPGNLRVDYVLPTTDWTLVDAGVFWPAPDEPGYDLIDASDHRLVWVDLRLPTTD